MLNNLIDKYSEEIIKDTAIEDYELDKEYLKSKLTEFAKELIGKDEKTFWLNDDRLIKNNFKNQQRQKVGIK